MDSSVSNFDQLPLSWVYSTKSTSSNYLKLGANSYWLYSCTISNISCVANLLDTLSDKPNTNFLIRGCSHDISNYLAYYNFTSTIIGKEAIIELAQNPFLKRSIMELVRRGLKNGTLSEIKYSSESIGKLEELKSHSAHSDEPQLKYLFIDKFISETRLFALIDKYDIWQGAILISHNSSTKIQTELLLRRKSAANGTMEALIQFIYKVLKDEGYSEWSLGEVPFIVDSADLPFLSKEYLFHKIGMMIKFAYNSNGLYFFKNKFATRWNTIYICANPHVKFKHIINISIKSNLFKLIINKLIKKLNISSNL